ncbi:MAG TPA: hypothetical protein VMN39_10910, partial [Longimicrobiaceae bacterium]|nr:hypothetical protein [Longimicrobiaceae bacterium]
VEPDDPRTRWRPAIRYMHGILADGGHGLLEAIPRLDKWRLCVRSAGPDEEYCTDPGRTCPVCRIFGTPLRPSRWSFGTLRPDGWLIDDPRWPAAPLAPKRTVRRSAADLRRRRPSEGKLFSEETGAPDRFVCEVNCSVSAEGQEVEYEAAFLVLAARTVAGVGRGRRRGRGECTIDLAPDDSTGLGQDHNRLMAAFRMGWIERAPGDAATPISGAPPLVRPADVAPAAIWVPADTPLPETVEVLMLLDEPAIAGTRPLAGNLLASHSFVPGMALLGALAGSALRAGRSADGDFLRVFRGGAASFPELHPVRRDGPLHARGGVPAPRDLHTCPIKPGFAPHGHGVWSSLLTQGFSGYCPETGDGLHGDGVKLRRTSEYLCPVLSNAEFRPSSREETKIAIDPALGRTGPGSLYHRETIPAGTLLGGTLLADSHALAYLLDCMGMDRDALGDEWTVVPGLRLGKRHSRGYGHVRIALRRGQEAGHEGLAHALANGHVAVLLTSRAILRDAFGRSWQSLEPRALGLDEPAHRAPAAVGTSTAGGYWRHIGMPRTEEYALDAGSVLHLRKQDYCERAWVDLRERLEALAERSYIGHRVHEGFGRFRLLGSVPEADSMGFPYAMLGSGLTDEFAGDRTQLPEEFRTPTEFVTFEAPAALRRKYAARIPTLVRAHPDKWRTMARVIHAHAGASADELLERLDRPRGAPGRAIEAARNAARKKRPFVASDGAEAWQAVGTLLNEAASESLDASTRAMHTRALADALADVAGAS